MKNIMWYMGFLSFLSLLFFAEGGTGFLGFLGFIPYFSTYKIKDERLEVNVGRATRNAFAFTMFGGSAIIGVLYLLKNTELLLSGFAVLFGGTLLVCIFSLLYYEKMKDENKD